MILRTRFLSPTAAAALALACARPDAAQRTCPLPAGQFLQVGTGPVEMAPGQAKVLSVGPSIGPDTPPGPLPNGCSARWSVDAGA
ncbi:MAG TPA: hypothetical protein VF541_11365, partial [Longimicrobium sp.]